MTRFLLLIALLSGYALKAQDFSGFWNGRAELMGQSLRVVFTLEGEPEAISGTFQSPDQGEGAVPISGQLEGDSLFIDVPDLKLTFRGYFDSGAQRIQGQMEQMGGVYPLTLQRDKLEAAKPNRPQTPQPPFPYSAEEVTFRSDGFELAGTLTKPDAFQQAIILVTGSGPQNRNSELLGHEPFYVIADHLSRNGIAVLRYDERGVGASEGSFASMTTLDFARDLSEALRWLKSQDGFTDIPIGVLGHSEGGLTASVCAAEFRQPDFIVSLAGMGVSGAETLIRQNEDVALAEGAPAELAQMQRDRIAAMCEAVEQHEDSVRIAKEIRKVLKEYPAEAPGMTEADLFNQFNNQMNSKWMRWLINADAREYWGDVRCPVLAINGTKDVQVNASQNLKAIEFALKRNGNEDYTTIALPNHNHLLQESFTGAVSEYGKIEQTISPTVLKTVTEWVQQR
jgi:hypothetical protein